MLLNRSSTILVLGAVALALWQLWPDKPVEHSQGQAALQIPREPVQPNGDVQTGNAAQQVSAAPPIKSEDPLSNGKPVLQTIPPAELAPERGALRREKLGNQIKPSAPPPGVQALQVVPPQPADGTQSAPRAALHEVPAQPLPPVSRTPYVPPEQPRDSAASAPQR